MMSMMWTASCFFKTSPHSSTNVFTYTCMFIIEGNIKQLLTFVEVNMFVCRPENPILTEALAEVNIMDIQVCKQTY